jgi:hypothetical protein
MARYRSVILGTPGKPPCPDEYTEAATLICQKSTRLTVQISNQTVTMQLGLMLEGQGSGLGSVDWQAEFPLLPMIASFARKFDAVRVQNFTPGFEAQIFITVD